MERLPTQVPGLDEVLHGGLPRYSTTLICGGPGSGKTVLASQIMFRNASPQQRALFVTTVSEPLARILYYGQQFTFFVPEWVPEVVRYEDIGPDLLIRDGERTLERLEKLILEHRPSLLVIDSIRALSALSDSLATVRRLLYRLSALLSTLPCNAFLVGEYSAEEYASTVEASIADAVFFLDRRVASTYDQRTLRVTKLRGSDYLPGEHTFRITSEGIRVFPRFIPSTTPTSYAPSVQRVLTGIPGLDEMLNGGLLQGTTTLLVGDPGIGKTVTALHFLLNGVRAGEPGVYFSLQEGPEQLAQVARNFGFDVDALLASGRLTFSYASPAELDIDEYAQTMLETLRRTQARRVVVDTIGDLEAGAHGDLARYFNFVYALVQWLKSNGVTAILTGEMSHLFGSDFVLSGRGVSHIADMLILLRYTQIGGEIRRALAVLASRGSDHSKQVREYLISEPQGPYVGAPLRHAFSLLLPTQREEI